MSGTSSVGQAGVYEAGDQRTSKAEDANDAERFNEGKPNSHLANDSKDQRSIANKLAAEAEREDEGKDMSEEARVGQSDPTAPAKLHGNEPSRGAKVDAELQAEEEEYLRRKGKADALPGKK